MKAARFLSGANTTTRRVSSSMTIPVPNRASPIQLAIPREYTLLEMGSTDDPVYTITFRPTDLARQPYPGVHFYHGTVVFSVYRPARRKARLAMTFTIDL